MSQNQGKGVDNPYSVSEDLSAKQFYGVKAGTTLHSVLLNDSAGGRIVGVLQDYGVNGSSDAKHANIRVSGETRAVAGNSITKLASVQCDAAGKFIPATTADEVCGLALEAATSDGDIILIQLGYAGIF